MTGATMHNVRIWKSNGLLKKFSDTVLYSSPALPSGRSVTAFPSAPLVNMLLEIFLDIIKILIAKQIMSGITLPDIHEFIPHGIDSKYCLYDKLHSVIDN